MLKRKFGWTNVDVPVIGQGTWAIEGSPEQETSASTRLQPDLLNLSFFGMQVLATVEHSHLSTQRLAEL